MHNACRLCSPGMQSLGYSSISQQGLQSAESKYPAVQAGLTLGGPHAAGPCS